MKKCQMLQRKILSLSNLSLFESETIFSRKIISERKTKLLLWIYVWQLSGYLWFNGRGKWPVASLNRDPCTGDYLHLHSAGCRRSPRLMSINPLLVALSFHNNHHHWFFLIEFTAGVCVCVCVCLYSSTVKASSVCKMSKTYLRVWINDLVLWILVDCVMPSFIIAVSENVISHLQGWKLRLLY